MYFTLIALALIMVGGTGALLTRGAPKLSTLLGLWGNVLGAVLGMVGAIRVLLSPLPSEAIRYPWSVPYGSFYVEVDALSAFFLLPIFLLTGLAAVYGARYLSGPKYHSRLGSHWFFFNTLAASMVMVIVARNAILFLVAWEVMALASFFLVTMESERESVQRAGWTYLVATHLGTMALFFLFILMGSNTGSLDFDRIVAAGLEIHPQTSLFFVLALIGFGTKAGIVPLHVWLPEAHPAAPSHVSAVMSGVMIKTGIYGIMRTLTWVGTPHMSWAVVLIAIGLISGVLGVLMALAQHDLKRLLAYHSVENIGIIFLGLGIGALGQAAGQPLLVVLGYGGALMHTLNHAIFKGLLFLGAGSVLHGAGTLDLEHTGGLLKRMPWTGTLFLTGAVAICGLPPLNGFISEFMIYYGAFQGVQSLDSWGAVTALVAIISLALIGGLAVACFTKAFGVVFLGEPRSQQAAQAHESGKSMLWPMAILAVLCLIIGLSVPLFISILKPALALMTEMPLADIFIAFDQIRTPLVLVSGMALIFAAFIAVLVWLRRTKLSGRASEQTVTWDCGYAQPTPRMQYTASSFAQPLLTLTGGFIGFRKRVPKLDGYFPSSAAFSTEAPDVYKESFWQPVFRGAEWLLLKFRWMQTGSIHLYILYIALTLIVLLITMLG
jgi:formate hydrogenlyase subunit 3/multisubunit Na+/H+ antiporter MnhD subunit